MEEWKNIVGYEGKYQISSLGRVKSLNYRNTGKEKILKQNINKGYKEISLFDGKTKKIYLVHRLVALHYISNPNNYPCVNHKDEDKTNNTVSNLEYCTYKYNNNYGTRNCRISKNKKGKYAGENHYFYGRHHTEETKHKMSKSHKNFKNEKNPRARKVICVNTREIFNYIKEVENKYNISSSSITQCCKNKRKSAGKHPVTGEKLVWKYYIEEEI